MGEGSGVGRRGGGLGGQGYGWEDATAQAPDRRNHRAKIERGGAFTRLCAPSIYLRSNRLTVSFRFTTAIGVALCKG